MISEIVIFIVDCATSEIWAVCHILPASNKWPKVTYVWGNGA